ncbi:prolipoprotein diacylglyceryl transferase [bacterium]|nr:prolipoprotein diacylglyceryl transferase [bacterium]
MHPILVSLGDFYIGTYGLLLALGLFLGSSVALWRARQVGVPSHVIFDLIFYGVLAGIVGSRLAYIVVDLLGEQTLLAHPAEMVFSRTNFVFLGGFLLAIPVCVFYLKRGGHNGWLVADVLAAGIPLGHSLGRIGCFMAGCCYGKAVENPESNPLSFLGVRFPGICRSGDIVQYGLAYQDHIHQGLIGPDATESALVWPVQLFESAGNLAIFLILFLLWKRRAFNGQMFLSYILLYGILRFGLEFLRGDVARGSIGPVSTSQGLIALILVAVGAFWFRRWRKRFSSGIAARKRSVS